MEIHGEIVGNAPRDELFRFVSEPTKLAGCISRRQGVTESEQMTFAFAKNVKAAVECHEAAETSA